MKSPRQYKIRNFLLLSFIIHLLIVQISGNLFTDRKKTKIPVRVKFIELKNETREDFNLIKGKIVEIPKPAKVEKPISRNNLSQYSSRAHGNKSAVKKKYKSTKTVSSQGKSKPRRAIKKKKPIKKKETVRVQEIKKGAVKKNKKKVVIAKKEAKKVAKKDELKETKKTPMVLKGLLKPQDDQEKDNEKNQNSLFKGFDPEKFAKLDTGNKEDESDTETVSLDSQELKYASYFLRIKKQIELVWTYPEEAATNGLQGQILLQFMLEQSGKLIDISLIQSSGHEILDRAALEAVKTASPYNAFPEKIRKKKLRIIASFKYKPFYTSYQ